MNEELIDIYDEQMKHRGTAARQEIHSKGYWHQTFHCWLVSQQNGEYYVLFQRRHPQKDTNPNKLDVTSAGHLLAGETIAEGVRELKEELGLTVSYENLFSLGVAKNCNQNGEVIDNEFCHVFVYESNIPLEMYSIQTDELIGLFEARIDDVLDLLRGQAEKIQVSGFQINGLGIRENVKMEVAKDEFVPREYGYYLNVLLEAKKLLNHKQ